jgi:hypothetical protein
MPGSTPGCSREGRRVREPRGIGPAGGQDVVDPVTPLEYRSPATCVHQTGKATAKPPGVCLRCRTDDRQITDHIRDLDIVQTNEKGGNLLSDPLGVRHCEATRPLPTERRSGQHSGDHERGRFSEGYHLGDRQRGVARSQALQYDTFSPQVRGAHLRPCVLHDETLVDHRAGRPPQLVWCRVLRVDPQRQLGKFGNADRECRSKGRLTRVPKPSDR